MNERRPDPFFAGLRGRRVMLGVLLLALTANWIWPEGGDEKEVRAAFERATRAWVDGDFETVWDSLAASARKELEDRVAAERMCAENEWFPWRPEEHEGRNRNEVLRTSARERFAADLRHRDFSEEQEYRHTVELIDGLRLGEVELAGDRARLRGDSADRVGLLLAVLAREDGEWKLERAVWGLPGAPAFMFPERKIACFLPKSAVRSERVALVLRAGPAALSAADSERLAAVLGALPPDPAVLLDLSPAASFQRTLEWHDEFMNAGVTYILMAAAGEEPIPDGVRVNGVPLADVDPGHLPPVPADDPALSRIISAGR